MATGNEGGQTALRKGRLMEIPLDSNVIISFSNMGQKSLRKWLKNHPKINPLAPKKENEPWRCYYCSHRDYCNASANNRKSQGLQTY